MLNSRNGSGKIVMGVTLLDLLTSGIETAIKIQLTDRKSEETKLMLLRERNQ